MKRDVRRWKIHKINDTDKAWAWSEWWGVYHAETTDLVAVFPTWRQCIDELSTYAITGKWAWQ